VSLPLVPVVPANNTVLWSGPGLPSPPALTMQREPSPILLSNRRRDIPPGGDAVSPTAPPPVTLKAAAAGDPGPQAHTEGVIPRSGRRHPRGLSRSLPASCGRSLPTNCDGNPLNGTAGGADTLEAAALRIWPLYRFLLGLPCGHLSASFQRRAVVQFTR